LVELFLKIAKKIVQMAAMVSPPLFLFSYKIKGHNMPGKF